MLFCRLLIAFILSFSVLFGGCSSPRPVAAESTPKDNYKSNVPHSREANDAARFLAGLPGAEGSPYAALEATDAWKEHRRLLDATWKEAEAEQFPGLHKFQSDELNDPALAGRTVFYPFSGPDALTATAYFPHNPLYVMVALEPAGTLPTPGQIGKKELPAYLGAIRDTMGSELGRSFFITRQMDRQFRGQVTDGLLAPILQLLVRTGHTVLGFRYIRLDEMGEVIDRTV